MGTKLANEIKAGDVIVLKDGLITVEDVRTDLRSYVQISWIAHGEHQCRNFHKDDQVTLAND